MTCNCNSCLVTKAAKALQETGHYSYDQALRGVDLLVGKNWSTTIRFTEAQIDTLKLLTGPNAYAIMKMILARKS